MLALLQPAAALPLAWATWIAVYDSLHHRIPNLLLLAALVPSLVWLCWQDQSPLGADWFDAGAGLFTGFFLALPGYVAARLGAGDVKLAAVLGLMQGLHGILLTLLLAALLLGAASLLVTLKLGRENSALLKMPAGVALCAGFVLSLTAGAWLPT